MGTTTSKSFYVSLDGSDRNKGTLEKPFRTIAKGLKSLSAGSTLYIKGGEYQEFVNTTVRKGTSSAPVKAQNYNNEEVIIMGGFRVSGASYWTFDGIKVKWADHPESHMVKIVGSNWNLKNCEIWGAKAASGLLISDGNKNVNINNCVFHDTFKTNDVNQDHLIYVSNAESVVIERNIFYNSENGRAIKVGPTPEVGCNSNNPRNIIIRYNTMYNNLGPSNVQFSYSANNNQVYRNIFQKSKMASENVTFYELCGVNNRVFDNIGWESDGVVEVGSPGLIDGGGNLFLDPQFIDTSSYNFMPQNPEVQNFGKFAP